MNLKSFEKGKPTLHYIRMATTDQKGYGEMAPYSLAFINKNI